MKRIGFLGIVFFLTFLLSEGVEAQRFLNKLKDKTEDKILDNIFNDKNNQDQQSNPNNQSQNNTSGTQNTKGGGLENTAPDVLANIDAAGKSFDSKDYSNTRYSIRQAILGVELEIGKNILTSLPDKVGELSKEPETDNVTSTGIGFVGLTIERSYKKGDKELDMTIANNSALLSSVNMYLANGSYASTNNDQNYKQVTLQGYRGVIEYDESSGYTLSVPFGQSSILVLQGINFENEKEMMDIADNFKIDSIKKQLGEQ